MDARILTAVAAGGALGSVARYLVMVLMGAWLGGGFPFGTLAVNLLGGFLLGGLIELMALSWSATQETRAFLVVGVLGGFTTFSTFSMDIFVLVERGDGLGAALYVAASVGLGLAAFFAGLAVVRALLA
ncbi:MAG: fluoride efflux transporter CrcB [Magnetospirillum sp. WYHS-4]